MSEPYSDEEIKELDEEYDQLDSEDAIEMMEPVLRWRETVRQDQATIAAFLKGGGE